MIVFDTKNQYSPKEHWNAIITPRAARFGTPRGMEEKMELLYPARALMLPLLFAALLLAACAAREEGDRDEGMTLSVDVREVHRCSRLSPEITVAYAPRGTKFYDVRLIEYGEEERFFGGGTWGEDGSGVIPEGALTRHYRGPCPPAGKSRDYAYVVSAMESETSQPLAVRLYRFTQE